MGVGPSVPAGKLTIPPGVGDPNMGRTINGVELGKDTGPGSSEVWDVLGVGVDRLPQSDEFPVQPVSRLIMSIPTAKCFMVDIR